VAGVIDDGEPRQHRGTFGDVGGRGQMQNFIVPGPPAVAKNDEVEVVERGRGGIVVVPRSREVGGRCRVRRWRRRLRRRRRRRLRWRLSLASLELAQNHQSYS
jgi:hypothetical protein